MKKFVLFISAIFVSAPCFALTEIGLSTNYRTQEIDSNNFSRSLSLTGSISYYFMEMSALEFSYTNGESKQNFREVGATDSTIATTEFEIYGVDFVLSFADRKSSFQPYVKLGAAKIKKSFKLKPAGGVESETAPPQDGIAPSAGIGVKIKFSQRFSLKLGIDAWASPIDDDDDNTDTIDYAGRAGISWIL